MSLNIKFLRTLEVLAREEKEEEALKRIESFPLAHSQPYLKAEYIKYFYSAAREYKQKLQDV